MVDDDLSNELGVKDAATRMYAAGDFEAGDTLLADHADRLSDYIKLECIGNRFFYKREFQDAVRCYEEEINMKPDHPVSRYQYLVGTQLEKKGNLVDAFKRYQAAIEIEPEFIDPYIELGGLLVKVEDYNGALRCYQDAFKLDSKDPKNIFNLKNILEKLVADGKSEYQSQLDSIQDLCKTITPPDDVSSW